MNPQALTHPYLSEPGRPRPRRSVAELLESLEIIAANSASLLSNRSARFTVNGEPYELPRYLFVGPQGGDDPIRIGLFATLHGDEPEGAQALVELVRSLEKSPEAARGYCLFIYPVCNPTGYEDNTALSRRGRDFDTEFWNHTPEPEVALLQTELYTHAFHGIVSLRSDQGGAGIHGLVGSATLNQYLIQPALAVAEAILERDRPPVTGTSRTGGGTVRQSPLGALSAPPGLRPRPFEIALHVPQATLQLFPERALVAALHTILATYREFIAYAANL